MKSIFTSRNALLLCIVITTACLSGLLSDEKDIPEDMAIPGAVLGIIGIMIFSKKRYIEMNKEMNKNNEHFDLYNILFDSSSGPRNKQNKKQVVD